MAQQTIESNNKKSVNRGKDIAKDTILTPNFYTTDFEAMEKMDLSITVSYTHLTLPTKRIV